MAVISSYGSYLIEASQLAGLATTVGQIESYAAKELEAKNFANTLKAAATAAKASGGAAAAGNNLLDNFVNMLQMTKVSSTDIATVQKVVATLKTYKDNDAYPSAMKNARSVIVGLATTLEQVTPAMMYSAMVN